MPIVVRHSPSIASIAEIARQGGQSEFLKWKTQFRQQQKNAQAQGIGQMLTLGTGFIQPFMLNAQRQKYNLANQAAAAGRAMQQSQADAGAMGHLLTGENTPFKNPDGTAIFSAANLAAMSPGTRSGLLKQAANIKLQDAQAQMKFDPERIAGQLLAQQDGQNLALEQRETALRKNMNDWMDLANHGIIGYDPQKRKFSDPAIQSKFERSVQQIGNMRAKNLPISARFDRETVPMQNGIRIGQKANGDWQVIDTNGPDKGSSTRMPKIPVAQYGEQPEWDAKQITGYFDEVNKREKDIAADYTLGIGELTAYNSKKTSMEKVAGTFQHAATTASTAGNHKLAREMMDKYEAKMDEVQNLSLPEAPPRSARRRMAMDQLYWERGGLLPPNTPGYVPPTQRPGGQSVGPRRPVGDRGFDAGEGADPAAEGAAADVFSPEATQLSRGANMYAAGPGAAESAWRKSLGGDRETAKALGRMISDPQLSVPFAAAAKEGLTLDEAIERDPSMIEGLMTDKEKDQFRRITEGTRSEISRSWATDEASPPVDVPSQVVDKAKRMTTLIGQERITAARVAIAAHRWSPPGEASLANIPAPTTDQLRDMVQAGLVKAGDVLIDPVPNRGGFVVIPQKLIDRYTSPRDAEAEAAALSGGWTGNERDQSDYARTWLRGRDNLWMFKPEEGKISNQPPPPPPEPRSFKGEAYPISDEIKKISSRFEESLPGDRDVVGTDSGNNVYSLKATIKANREARKFVSEISHKMQEDGYGNDPRHWPGLIRALYFEAERWVKLKDRGRMMPPRTNVPGKSGLKRATEF